MKRKSNEKADIKIRLTEGLRLKIERSAKARGTSMNADMIERLERSFTHDAYLKAESDHSKDLEETLDKVMAENQALHEQQAEIVQKLDMLLALSKGNDDGNRS